MKRIPWWVGAVVVVAIVACGTVAQLPLSETVGTNPKLPAAQKELIPTVNVAEATGWSATGAPTPASGMVVTRFAVGLDHPRWVYVLPNGDVLVAESAAPPRPEDGKGVKAQAMKFFMKRAGSAVPSANRITLLRDADGDGIAEIREVFLQGLNSPFGIALVGGDLYIANTDGVVRYPYKDGDRRITASPTRVVELPAGPRNRHWTKNIIASADGSKLYATVGSNSNVAENGMAEEEGRAAIWEIDRATGAHRIFASGLRNPNGMAWVGSTLWTVVNERDELGSDLVPDYLTSVRDGAFYGWPYSYYGQHVDARVQPPRPDLVAKAVPPDYALGPHVAALGLAAAQDTALPAPFKRGVFIGEHGSWNRKPFSGYKVVFVAFDGDRPTGSPHDVLTGFLSEDGKARGRPVGVALDRKGGLLVADDVGNIIWRVAAGR